MRSNKMNRNLKFEIAKELGVYDIIKDEPMELNLAPNQDQADSPSDYIEAQSIGDL